MSNTNTLLNKIYEAHGGLEKWNKYQKIEAHLNIGGVTWSIKGHEGALADVYFEGSLKEQHAKWKGLFRQNFISDFSPEHVSLLDENSQILEELQQPFESFSGHEIETPWTRAQLVYFSSYATWNYLTTPFNFNIKGLSINEIEPWDQDGETWRRLEVLYPEKFATHSRRQVYYFSEEGLLKRHDYWPKVLGGSSATQIINDYKEFSGIRLGTKRNIYILNDTDNSYLLEPVLVSIDVLDAKFS